MMSLRNRKTKGDEKQNPEDFKEAAKKIKVNRLDRLLADIDKSPAVMKWLVRLQWCAIITVMLMPIFVIGWAYLKWGPNYFLPDSYTTLELNEQDWQKVFKNRTMAMIGGPHRGGTTIIWDAVRRHPKISDFGDTHESGLDFSEGVFAQRVYSAFGVGAEFKRENALEGVGRYALAPEENVHLKADNRLVTTENMIKVLNRFGYLWDLTDKPILLEKSPTNAVYSSFLQALFNSNNEGWDNAAPNFGGGRSRVKFIFVTRDPMANAYAQKKMGFNKNERLSSLLQNWINIHKYMIEDIPKLQYSHFVKFEDFEADPVETVKKIWQYLGLQPDANAIEEVKSIVTPGQNKKYIIEHCRGVLSQPNGRDHYDKLATKFNDKIKQFDLGYDLTTKLWRCDFDNVKQVDEEAKD